jgi:peptide deformylase
MSIREIRLFGDPVLKTASESITDISDSIKTLIRDLEDTTALAGRAGVAAPQIGVNLRAFSYEFEDQVAHLINPEIVEVIGEKVEVNEGCLSLPELWGMTPRYESVRVKATNLSGDQIEILATGFLAQIVQHEIDHLDGILYIDRLTREARKTAMAELRQTNWFLKN